MVEPEPVGHQPSELDTFHDLRTSYVIDPGLTSARKLHYGPRERRRVGRGDQLVRRHVERLACAKAVDHLTDEVLAFRIITEYSRRPADKSSSGSERDVLKRGLLTAVFVDRLPSIILGVRASRSVEYVFA